MIKTRMLWLPALAAVALTVMVRAASPFEDAVAAWGLADATDAAGRPSPLSATGAVRTGVPLAGAEREDSIRRGGDGMVAAFDGGWLDAGQGAGGELNIAGSALTFLARLRDPTGRWDAPLVAKHGGHEDLVFNLFSADLGDGMAIGFELGTEGTGGMTQTTVPVSLIGAAAWHDIVCRYDGAKLRMVVDGVLVDEGFPVGPLRGNREPCLLGAESHGGSIKAAFRGVMDHVVIWDRALDDAEIEHLCGGREEVARRERETLGAPGPIQYWKPINRFNVGDTLPFFHDGVFHFYYLLDRGHHSAKGGLGAHQWAHASSTDLVRWTHHPLAIPITDPSEGSICTGSVFWHDGLFRAYYATRIVGKGEHLSLAVSRDGIRFEKKAPNPFLSPGPRHGNGFRDPHVFRDPATGLFHLIVSTMLLEGNRGCLAHYTSPDLEGWTEAEPFLVEGNEVPECPDTFEWNGHHYLLFSNGGVARYRVADGPLGPWRRPRVDILDGTAARVIKTAAFTGNRRLATAFLDEGGYASRAVFRELVQLPDGTLGTRFPPEMVPETGPPVALGTIRVAAAEETRDGCPPDGMLVLSVRPGAGAETFGVAIGAGAAGEGHRIIFHPSARRLEVAGGRSLEGVEGLDRPFSLEVVFRDGLLDLCVDRRRTLVQPVPARRGGRLVFFAEAGEVSFEGIEVCPRPGESQPAPSDLDRPPPGYRSKEAVLAALALGMLVPVDMNPPLPDGVKLEADVEYGRAGDAPLLLDLYSPETIEAPVPALIFIHGGAWKGGKRQDYRVYTVHFAGLGYVAATISYRLVPKATFPAQIEDVKCAIRWMRSQAERLRIDPERIAVLGGSAGGHLALLAGYAEVPSQVAAVVNFYGPSDLTTPFGQKASVVKALLGGKTFEEAPDLWRLASPITHLRKGAPPTLILHGTIDDTVPIDQSDSLAARLKELGVPHEYGRLEGWPHTMDAAVPVNDYCKHRVEAFLRKHLGSP